MNNILMNTEMTKAILDCHKVQTRRVIPYMGKLVPKIDFGYKDRVKVMFDDSEQYFYSKYRIGETIRVREPVKIEAFETSQGKFDIRYMADGKKVSFDMPKEHLGKSWTKKVCKVPNGCIKEMARIFLKITNVRAERLQDISEDDCVDEGIEIEEVSGEWFRDYLKPYLNYDVNNVTESFESLWDSTAPKGYKWEDNPYVFVYEFERVGK